MKVALVFTVADLCVTPATHDPLMDWAVVSLAVRVPALAVEVNAVPRAACVARKGAMQ